MPLRREVQYETDCDPEEMQPPEMPRALPGRFHGRTRVVLRQSSLKISEHDLLLSATERSPRAAGPALLGQGLELEKHQGPTQHQDHANTVKTRDGLGEEGKKTPPPQIKENFFGGDNF